MMTAKATLKAILRNEKEKNHRKKNLGIGDPDSFPLEIKGMQSIGNSGDLKPCTRYENNRLHRTRYPQHISIVVLCQHRFYHRF